MAHWDDGMGRKGRNMDVIRIDFAMDSRDGFSKFFKGVADIQSHAFFIIVYFIT